MNHILGFMPESRKGEYLLYTLSWALIYVSLGLYAAYKAGFSSGDILMSVLIMWGKITSFLVAFEVHDLFVLKFLFSDRKWLYFILAALLLTSFALLQNIIAYNPVLMFFLLIYVVGANISIHLYFRSMENAKRLEVLERESLSQQLTYLRQQINPHFFMNTLNNIHALIDIDPNKAKKSILQLSKLLRHLLYDISKPMIPLEKEIDSVKQYVELMKIRYTANVKVELSMPDSAPGREIPPLVYSSFVENAFKHGVSYEEPSFVDVSIVLEEGKTIFSCKNSDHSSINEQHTGIGLPNIRKRLDLLYGDRYELRIDRTDGSFRVLLTTPEK